MLRNVLEHDEKAVTIEIIQKFVADYYQLKVSRAEVAEQLEVGRDAAADRDVSLQDADARVAAGDRPELRRQASLDGDPLDPEDRRSATEATEISTRLSTTFCESFPLSDRGVFHRLRELVRLCTDCAVLRGPKFSTGPAPKNPPRYPQDCPQAKLLDSARTNGARIDFSTAPLFLYNFLFSNLSSPIGDRGHARAFFEVSTAMELVVRKNDLLRELQLFQGIVERKNTIPILANVLIEADGDEVKLLATDLEVGLRSRARRRWRRAAR